MSLILKTYFKIFVMLICRTSPEQSWICPLWFRKNWPCRIIDHIKGLTGSFENCGTLTRLTMCLWHFHNRMWAKSEGWRLNMTAKWMSSDFASKLSYSGNRKEPPGSNQAGIIKNSYVIWSIRKQVVALVIHEEYVMDLKLIQTGECTYCQQWVY